MKRRWRAEGRRPRAGTRRPRPKRAARGSIWPLAGLVLLVVLIAGGLTAAVLVPRTGLLDGDAAGDQAEGKQAAIVDQLSLAFPDGGEFVESATRTLERGGYEVEYVGGEDVTVDVYKKLPKRGDDLIILRVHNAFGQAQGYAQGFAGLFTGERYGVRRHDEPGLGVVGTSEGGDDWYFGIGPEFVESAMEGAFDGALVVLMGCSGLESSVTAQAFLDRGARAVVGWSDFVSLEHTDAATERLLTKVVEGGLSPERAVEETREEVGPDPYFGAELRLLAEE